MVAKPKTVEQPQTQPVQMLSQETTVGGDVEMKDDAKAVGDKEGDLFKSSINLENFVSPKQAYLNEANKETEVMKQALMNLFEFGFTDIRINRALMTKYKDANVAAEKLCMGLSEQETADLILDDDLYN